MTSFAVARAPVRAFDAGGWTDTWFAGHGAVCHVALEPGAEVVARLLSPHTSAAEVVLQVAAFGDHYAFDLDEPPGRHPLLEATLRRWAPRGHALDVRVSSPVPAGSSLGTSAAVTVALITALQALHEGDACLTADGAAAVARYAHRAETDDLGRQSGVQDQVAAAFGGANLVRVHPYPEFEVDRLEVPATMLADLSQRCFTVYLGAMHDSSTVHSTVIANLESDFDLAQQLLSPLRDAALSAASALTRGDLRAYGDAMSACTQAQARLHPSLVNPVAREVMAVAEGHGSLGCKVNGAGGPGGTVSIVGPEDPEPLKAALCEISGVSVLDLAPCLDGARTVDRG